MQATQQYSMVAYTIAAYLMLQLIWSLGSGLALTTMKHFCGFYTSVVYIQYLFIDCAKSIYYLFLYKNA